MSSTNYFGIIILIILILVCLIISIFIIQYEVNFQKDLEKFCEFKGMEAGKYWSHSCQDFQGDTMIIREVKKIDGRYYFVEKGGYN